MPWRVLLQGASAFLRSHSAEGIVFSGQRSELALRLVDDLLRNAGGRGQQDPAMSVANDELGPLLQLAERITRRIRHHRQDHQIVLVVVRQLDDLGAITRLYFVQSKG